MVMRHHEEQRQKEEKAKRDEHAKIRRVASSIAKEVRAFWSSVEKVQMIHQNRANKQTKHSGSAVVSERISVCLCNKSKITWICIVKGPNYI